MQKFPGGGRERAEYKSYIQEKRGGEIIPEWRQNHRARNETEKRQTKRGEALLRG